MTLSFKPRQVIAKDFKTVVSSTIKPVEISSSSPAPAASTKKAIDEGHFDETFQCLIILIILVFLSGFALAVYHYWRKNGSPSLRLLFSWCSCPGKCPEIKFPCTTTRILNLEKFTGRQISGPSFSFSRFSNERISPLNFSPAFEGFMTRMEPVDSIVHHHHNHHDGEEESMRKMNRISITNIIENNSRQIQPQEPSMDEQSIIILRSTVVDGYSNNIYDIVATEKKQENNDNDEDDDEKYKDNMHNSMVNPYAHYCDYGETGMATEEEPVYAVIEGPSLSSHYENVSIPFTTVVDQHHDIINQVQSNNSGNSENITHHCPLPTSSHEKKTKES